MEENAIKNTLLNGRIEIRQPQSGYRSAIDPILLAAACHPQPGEHIADLGCGVGTIGACLHYFEPDIKVTGYEIQPFLADLARENLPKHFNIFNNSIENIDKKAFDCAVMNPPYYEVGANIPSPATMRATAHSGQLELWFQAAAKALRNGGTLSFILPALRYGDAMRYLKKYQCGAVQVYPIFSKADQPAKRLIFQARRHKSGETLFHRGIVMHENNGDYTAEARNILFGENKINAFKKVKHEKKTA